MIDDLPSAISSKRWYAVHTRSRHEKVVAAQLRGRGVDIFLPLVNEIHRWSDRRKRVQVPLFPGYAFIHACESAETVMAVTQVESVVGIVGAPPNGTAIPDEQIEAVQRLLSRNIPCVNYPFLKAGQRVRIRGGVLEGVEGTLVSLQGTTSLVISIELIQRSLAVRLEGYDVEVI
jgi:transcription antitermination factor NusG